MAPLLRRRCVCFYCGSKSSQIKTPTLRQFKCEKCEAVNHLDEVCLLSCDPIFCSVCPFSTINMLIVLSTARRHHRPSCIFCPAISPLRPIHKALLPPSCTISRRFSFLPNLPQEPTLPYRITSLVFTIRNAKCSRRKV